MRISDWSSDVCSSDLFDDALNRPRRSWLSVSGLGLAEAVGTGVAAIEPRRPDLVAHHFNGRSGTTAPGPNAYNGSSRRPPRRHSEIGRAPCRERVGQYGLLPVCAVSLKKKKTK